MRFYYRNKLKRFEARAAETLQRETGLFCFSLEIDSDGLKSELGSAMGMAFNEFDFGVPSQFANEELDYVRKSAPILADIIANKQAGFILKIKPNVSVRVKAFYDGETIGKGVYEGMTVDVARPLIQDEINAFADQLRDENMPNTNLGNLLAGIEQEGLRLRNKAKLPSKP